ncbi:MAG: bifunctional DNA primase/polymerase [Pirellulales bacterium]
MRENPERPATVEWIKRYAQLQWSMIALRPPVRWDKRSGKAPFRPWKEQTRLRLTEAELGQILAKHPNANIGVVCGRISGIVVVDLDSAEAIGWAEKNLARSPLVAITRQGEHWYFRHPGIDVAPGTKLHKTDLDVRGDGSYVVVPPSIHYSGHVYGWREEPTTEMLHELPLFDPAWRAEVRRHKAAAKIEPGPADPVTRAAAYIATIPGAVSGQGGHAATFRVACILVQRFGLSVEQAYPLLLVWNAKCEPNWKPQELRRKLEEALRVMGSKRGDIQRTIGG